MTVASVAAPVKIRLRTPPAAAGLHWIRRGLHTFWRRPLGFVGLWLFFTVVLFGIMILAVAVSPVALLAMAAWMPLLTVGYMEATSDVLNDLKLRPAVFGAPFSGTTQSARATLVIMLVYMAVVALLVACADAMDGGETRRWVLAAMTPGPDGKPPVMQPPSDATVSSIRFVMVGTSLASIPLWYAPALVHWGRQGAVQAMFSSVVAIWRSKAAFFTFLAGWFVIGVAFDLVVQLLVAAFGAAAVGLAVLTGQMILSIAWFVSLWFGFVDTFEISQPAAFRTVMADTPPPAS